MAKELLNRALPQAAAVLVSGLKEMNEPRIRDENELKLEGELRAKSLIQLLHYIAKPKDCPYIDAQHDFETIKKSLIPGTNSPTDQSQVFGEGSASAANFILRAERIWDDDRPANEGGIMTISLRLARKPSRRPSVDVYFRERRELNSKPYILVKYSENEKYRFELDEDGEITAITDFNSEGVGKTEDFVKTDLNKTCNEIGHTFGIAVDLKDISIAGDMGQEMLTFLSGQIANKSFVEG